jgi:nucleoid-associated protein YgaU
VTYTIQKGDTLIKISEEIYGNEFKVQDICKLNGITNPDDIKFGQTITLP